MHDAIAFGRWGQRQRVKYVLGKLRNHRIRCDAFLRHKPSHITPFQLVVSEQPKVHEVAMTHTGQRLLSVGSQELVFQGHITQSVLQHFINQGVVQSALFGIFGQGRVEYEVCIGVARSLHNHRAVMARGIAEKFATVGHHFIISI